MCLKISIITVCYNSEKYISSALESVLRQTYPNIEYIIVDGGSKDSTVEIIRRYEALFTGHVKWISEPDQGIYDAMNKGITMCTGDVIGILNSDDFFVNNEVIADIASVFKNTDTDSVFGNLYMVAADKTKRVVRKWKGSEFIKGSFSKGWHPAHPTFYVKRSVYERYGMFDTSYAISADFELMLRFLERHNISTTFIDSYFVKMRMGGASTGSLSAIIKGNRNILRAFKENDIKVNYLLYPFYRFLPKIKQILKNKVAHF